MSEIMSEEFEEFVTFTVTDKDGNEVEMAVMEEFEFEGKTYVAAAKVEGDTISEEGLFIYKATLDDGELKAEKISNKIDYEKVVKAYLEME